MAASPHGSPFSTSPQDYHSLFGYGVSHGASQHPHHSHYQDYGQTKAEKEYRNTTNLPNTTDIETSQHITNSNGDATSNQIYSFDNDSGTAETSVRCFLSTSPGDIYIDSSLPAPIASIQQNPPHVHSKGQMPNNTDMTIDRSQRKRANTISAIASPFDTLLPLDSRSRTTSVPSNRPRSTSLVNMNPAPAILNMCDDHPNAANSCPTLGTKLHSDNTIERPSDAFRNRQKKRLPLHHESSSPSNTSPPLIHQHQDSIQQLELKEEISTNLVRLKETSADSYDFDFWEKAIHQFDHIKQQQHQILRDHVCIGMPPTLRGMIWQVFSKSRHNSDMLELEYHELLQGVSPHEKIMRRDLARTFPTHAFFQQRDGDGQEMLFSVIKAYSLYDPQVGYCQGLPFIVGCLLLHMPDESAFCVLVNLMNEYGLRGHFTPKMELLHERLFQYEELMMKRLPQIHRHLDAQGVLPTMYASQWFLTLFSSKCPLNLAFRVLDMVFTESTCIILNVALALLEKSQATILGLEFEGLLSLLNSDIFGPYQDTPTEFVKDTFAFHISRRELTKLSKKYKTKATRYARIQEKEDYLKTENYELSQQAKKLEKSFTTLEQEHETIAKQVIECKMAMATGSVVNQELRHEISQLEQQMQGKQQRMDSDFNSMDELGRFSQENAYLEQQNVQLERRLAEVETALVDLKLKYAECENEYEQMRKIGQIGKSSS